MLQISEWLPNPLGADAKGEWIELVNTGNTPVSLSGWRLETKNGKRAPLSGEIGADGFVILPRVRTKLTLTNRDEALTLFDASGRVADTSAFPGTAPEGKSFSRQGERFTFAAPSPGEPNPKAELALISTSYQTGAPLHSGLGTLGVFELALGVGVLITSAILFITLKNNAIRDILFSRDP